ncbi:ABC transporter substrate-binding protein [Candidatus Kaiserbacteria bacterium]|nr:ABC transporter substrate-binding protein [Candidatus Kaiserbacteria bacterium]
MSNTAKLILGIIALMVIAGAIIFYGKNPDEKNNLVEGETLKIGWVGPLTGQSAAMGEHSSTAVQIAVDEINAAGGVNGKKIELFVEDDQYSAEKTLSAYRKLVDLNKVKIILLQNYTAIFTLAEKAETEGVLLFDVVDCNDRIVASGDNTVCLGIESESISRPLADYSEKQGFKKVGIVHFNSDQFFPYVKDVFVEDFDGQTVVEGYVAGTNDFKTIMTKMVKEDVEAIVLLSYDEGGLAIKQARELGFKGPFLMAGTVASPTLQELAQGKAEGTIFTFWNASRDDEMVKKFNTAFAAKKGHEPFLDFSTYPAYDAVRALAKALSTSKDTSFDGVKSALISLKEKGLTGDIDFKEDGGARVPYSLYELKGGMPTKLVE